MNRFFGHLSTILRHRHQVIRHCFKAGIGFQGLRHDLSKLSPAEFIPGVRNYQGNRSPTEHERETRGYSAAWLHHKGRNKHHLEYWIDYDVKGDQHIAGMRMPEKYVAEMVADRIAASKIYKKEKYTDASPLEYYMQKRDYHILHPETKELLEKLLNMLAEKGEDETFRYIREEVLKK